MRFVVLGSGTAFADPARGPAGFLLQAASRSWWIDGGSGTLQRSARAGVGPTDLAGGIYSHHHPDHCADLVPLLFARRVARCATPYPIHAGPGFRRVLDGLEAAFGRWILPEPTSVTLRDLPGDRASETDLGGVRLHTAPANHGAGALHLGFEADGARVVFSGDTGPSPALVTLASGADLLVCECAGADDDPVPGHLTPSGVAALVDAARPARVWLTHLYPQVDPTLAVATVAATGIPVRHAQDGDAWASVAPAAVGRAW